MRRGKHGRVGGAYAGKIVQVQVPEVRSHTPRLEHSAFSKSTSAEAVMTLHVGSVQ